MATKRSILLERLATARAAKMDKKPVEATGSTSKPLRAPKPVEDTPELGIVTNPQRELAKEVTDMAMVAGWSKAIQEGAYKNRISEDEMRKILDEALEYQDKADASGRIDGIEDWAHEKRGSSTLARVR